MQEKWIDEQQEDDRVREHPHSRGRPACERREQRDRGHHRRAQHRRLEPGHRREHEHDGEREQRAPGEREATEYRPGESQHERDVLAGDDQEMTEPGVAVVGLDVGRDCTRVAEKEAGDECSVGRRERSCAAHHDTAEPVGEREDSSGRSEGFELRVVEPRDCVTPASTLVEIVVGAQRCQTA